MSISLRTRLTGMVVLLIFGSIGVGSIALFLSFRYWIHDRQMGELGEEAEAFSYLISYRDGQVQIQEGPEWKEVEHTQDSDHAMYLTVTDPEFKTIRKTANLGSQSIQDKFQLVPVSEISEADPKPDNTTFMCLVVPLRSEEGRIFGYLLSATKLNKTNEIIRTFQETAGLSLLAAAILGGLAAFVLVSRLTRPLRKIEKITAEMDFTSLDKRISLKSKETEVLTLVSSLNELFERLQRSFRQINEFSSNASHELRTPLTIMRGKIEVGLSRERTNAEYVTVLSDVLEEVLHLSKLVEDMLLLARADNRALIMKSHPLDLRAFCKETISEWQMLCDARQQTLQCKMIGTHWIDGDRNLLYQMFLNLISNASKYSDVGTSIEVTVASENESTVCIDVADHGDGIPEDECDLVFTRFYRVDKGRSRNSGGAGLGLSIARMIAESHGGTIELRSQLGRGTTVSVRLPTIP